MFGIANAALGILSTMCIGLTIDAYGTICDNAGGIAEMSGMSEAVRDRTDALDAAGNTTAAIGKGFAIGSAALVALALFGAFVTSVNMSTVNILEPFQFSGLLVGAMLPYWFSALTMKSVGEAAQMMIQEVDRQFEARPELIDACKLLDREEELKELRSQQANGLIDDVKRIEEAEKSYQEDYARLANIAPPDYAACVAISTEASLREMIPPGALVMLTPLIVGFLFGVEALAGVLAGTLSSGVQMAISSSNTGGAWDNAKKYIEAGLLREQMTDRRTGVTQLVVFGKGTKEHKAAVIGDTVGDPLKDTSGPALNILVKLSAIISLVFAKAFPSVEDGGWLVQLANKIA
jgi:inorganic pyrophosphatase